VVVPLSTRMLVVVGGRRDLKLKLMHASSDDQQPQPGLGLIDSHILLTQKYVHSRRGVQITPGDAELKLSKRSHSLIRSEISISGRRKSNFQHSAQLGYSALATPPDASFLYEEARCRTNNLLAYIPHLLKPKSTSMAASRVEFVA
jgi:hypothetical protein